MRAEGRAWVFGDDISTDLLYPQDAYRVSLEDAAQLVFRANRPGWAQEVQPGDVIVAGRNFGMGSSRPAPVLLRRLGISAVVAESISPLFLRNCVNLALPVFACPGVLNVVSDGDEVAVDLRRGCVSVARSEKLRAKPLPSELMDIIESGGLMRSLEERGLVARRSAA